MTIAQVGKYMPEGVRAFSNLMNMLVEAAVACKLTVKKYKSWNESMGLYLEGKRYWVGVNFSEPEYLQFSTMACRIDPADPQKVAFGEKPFM